MQTMQQCLNWRQMDQIALRVRTEQIYNNTTSYTIARNCFMFFEKKIFEFSSTKRAMVYRVVLS